MPTLEGKVWHPSFQSQIQDFPKEGAPFVRSAKSTWFSGGGGSSRYFPWSPPKADVQKGGPGSPKGREYHQFGVNYALYIFGLSQRGARAPRAPPLNRPLLLVTKVTDERPALILCTLLCAHKSHYPHLIHPSPALLFEYTPEQYKHGVVTVFFWFNSLFFDFTFFSWLSRCFFSCNHL